MKLATEHPEDLTISWNGVEIDTKADGWYVDPAICTIPIGDVQEGQNILIIEMPYKVETNVEWSYLLGDFGVEVHGDHSRITEPVRSLYFGDWTVQGLPFYGGNVTYHFEVEGNGGECLLEASKYRNPLLKVRVDGEEKGVLAYAPYRISLGRLDGVHKVELTAFGNRVNSFGPVHLCDEKEAWCGPMAWRSEGTRFCYEYQLKRTGILSAPVLLLEKEE